MNWRGDEKDRKPLPVLSIALIAMAVWAALMIIIWEVG